MPDIALFGASGAIGQSIVTAFRQQSRNYRVVGRSRSSLETSFGHDPLAELVTWNPDDPGSVRQAVEGVRTIIYLVGVPYNHFQLHPQLMRQTLEGATAAGVENFLLIGTVYPYGLPHTTPVKEDHPREPHTFKGRMRKEQEDLLLGAEAQGRIRASILRLPDFYGPGVEKSFLDSLFKAAATGGRAQMIGPIDTPHEFVFVPDVGPVVAALISEPRAWGKTWHLAGPGTITQREAIEKVFAMSGHGPRYMVAGKTMLRILGLFNSMLRELVEIHYLLTNPIIMDDSALRSLLPTLRKTPYADGFRQALEAAGSASRAAR